MSGLQSIPRSHWLGWGLAVALTALSAIAAFTYRAYQKAASELIVERDRQVAYLSASRLKEELNSYSDLLQAVGRLRDIALGDDATRRAALHASRNRLAIFDGGVVLLDNFGRVVTGEPEREGIVGTDWSNKDFFTALLTNPSGYYSNISDDGPFGARVIVVSVPLLGDEGEFVGALAGMFRLGEPSISSFYASIVKLRLGQTQAGHTYIIDGRNRLLFDSGAGQQEPMIGGEIDIQRLAGIAVGGTGDAARTRDADGHDIVAAYAPVPGTEWTLVMEDDWVELSGPTRRYGLLLVGLLGVGMALPAIAVVFLLRERDSETIQQQSLDQENRVANLIQRMLLPEQIPMIPGWNVCVHYRPTAFVGGDFYDLLLLPDGRLAIALANIPDRGVSAAVIMATTRAAIRGAARRILSPKDALESMNTLLCAELEANDTVRCIFAILDPSSSQLALAVAGHSPPYCSQFDGVETIPLGAPLGMSLDSTFEQVEATIQPGSCLAFFGEGVFDARNDHGDVLDRDRLHDAMESLSREGRRSADDLLEKLGDYLGPDRALMKDVTIITLEHRPAGGLGG